MSSTSHKSLDWGAYAALDAAEGVRIGADPVKSTWEVLPKAVAFERYERLMAIRRERVPMIMDLARRNGYAAGLDEDGLAELNRLLLDALPRNHHPDAVTGAEFITARWVSVLWDMSLALGESAIDRYPHLRWEFYDPKLRNAMWKQNPSIVGHRKPGRLSLPFLHVEGYAMEICRPPGRPYVAEAKGHVFVIEPDPIRPNLFRILSQAEDRYA